MERICPHCKTPVFDDEALLCLYCGESLNRGAKYFPAVKVVFLIIVLVLLLGFFLAILPH